MNRSFQSGLNQHGYAFQYRVLQETTTVAEKHFGASWRVFATELPVAVASESTRIDFVLERDADPTELRLLLAECKRVNPAFGTWCFAKAPYVTPSWADNQVIAESIVGLNSPYVVSAGVAGTLSDHCYHVAFSLKTDRAGDPQPVANDKDAIEGACGQILKGCNGLAQQLVREDRWSSVISSKQVIQLFPAVFTTADLWVTTADLSHSDLATGSIALGQQDVKRVDWLYYQYPQSPAFRHNLPVGTLTHDGFSDIVAREFLRTVAIVSPGGIEAFLESGWLQVCRGSIDPQTLAESQ